ncbi:MAG: UvrD-helicase domain-containing protein [Clostridia bacterium]|nr:UvrD-helicase domain-containing protein [Clostridia bacterium]
MEITASQQKAIDARNKTLLVSAAAGSGKTFTLTSRIIASLLDETHPADITKMLIVTFTNAATEELRAKITKALSEALLKNPNNARLERQLHLLPTASIRTIDAFCNDILKTVAEGAGLPPGYRVPDMAEIDLLRARMMNSTVESYYENAYADTLNAAEFSEIADCLSLNKADGDVEVCLTYLYQLTQTHEDGVRSLRPMAEKYLLPESIPIEGCEFGERILLHLHRCAGYYLNVYSPVVRELEDIGEEIYLPYYAYFVEKLKALCACDTYLGAREILTAFEPPDKTDLAKSTPDCVREVRKLADAAFLDEIIGLRKQFFSYSEEEFRKMFARLYKITSGICSVLENFDRAFRAEKKRLGICEYSDMEYYTYEALYGEDGQPSEFALSLRDQYEAVYIDEYQDVNRLQNKIFEAISRPDNRFMVGDVKQSIYGFRNADPTIFAEMKSRFPALDDSEGIPAAALFMSENFRCDETVVNYVNEVFGTLFVRACPSVGYKDGDKLNFRKLYDKDKDIVQSRPVEILHVNYSSRKKDTAEDAEKNALTNLQAEAAAVAEKIRSLMENEKKNRADESGSRDLHYSDIVILMRNAGSKGPDFAAELEARGIPVTGDFEGDLLKSPEVLLTLCLLGAIDNPCRDVYLTGLMLSPLFNFTPDELALIRTGTSYKKPFYRSLTEYVEKHPEFEKGASFLKTLSDYRRISEGMPVEKFLYRLYRETGLFAVATEHGRQENLLRLYEYARKFEQSSYRGLYTFVSYLCRVLENKAKFGGGESSDNGGDAVRIVTIHHSKGLEYPVVILAGTGSSLFGRTANAGERFIPFKSGFGFSVNMPDEKKLSLVKNPVCNLIESENARDGFEEELRVLYVALTRAQEKLIITGLVPDEEKRKDKLDFLRRTMTDETFYRQTTYLDLLELSGAFAKTERVTPPIDEDEEAETEVPPTESEVSEEAPVEPDGELTELLKSRFSYTYPDPVMTRVPEKLSVSVLYPAILDEDTDEELTVEEGSSVHKPRKKRTVLPDFYTGVVSDDGAKRGIATHEFLQFCDFSALLSHGVKEELDRLTREKFLSAADREKVRIDELEKFRVSALLREMSESAEKYREFRFNVLLPAEKFTSDPDKKIALTGQKLLVQGVIDCLFRNAAGDLVLVDYKTDRLTKEELSDREKAAQTLTAKHRSQLLYYAEAVEKMFGAYPKKILIYSLPLGDTVEVK